MRLPETAAATPTPRASTPPLSWASVAGSVRKSWSWVMPSEIASWKSAGSPANHCDCGIFSSASGIETMNCPICVITGGRTKTRNAATTTAKAPNTMPMPAPRFTP